MIRPAHSARRTRRAGWLAAVSAALMLVLAPGRATAQKPAGGGEAVAMAAADLPRGTVLAREHIAAADSALLGWVTRRMIAKGEPLRSPAIAPPELVKAGEVVRLVWRQGGIEIQLVGKAMGGGAKGERVQVRVDSKRRFAGVVEGPGLVRMDAQGNQR